MYTVRDSIGIGDCRGTDGRSTLRAIENVGLEIDLPNGIAGKNNSTGQNALWRMLQCILSASALWYMDS